MQDKFKINKIATVLLSSVLFIAGYGTLTRWNFNAHAVEKTDYERSISTNAQDMQTGDDAINIDLDRLLATSNKNRGKSIYQKNCASCHTYRKGERNKNGPNLYGIVGRSTASIDDFVYSRNMKSIGGTWTVDTLNAFLDNPQQFIPRTKMTFRGLHDKKIRADLLLYLKSISPQPPGKTDE